MSNDNELHSLLKRNAENRLNYLIEQIKQHQEIWILTDDTGAVMFQSEDEDCIPIWPSKDVAQLWCNEDWQECRPHAIDVATWKSKWTPGLEDDEVNILVFPNDDDEGIVLLPWEFNEHLEAL